MTQSPLHRVPAVLNFIAIWILYLVHLTTHWTDVHHPRRCPARRRVRLYPLLMYHSAPVVVVVINRHVSPFRLVL